MIDNVLAFECTKVESVKLKTLVLKDLHLLLFLDNLGPYYDRQCV